MGDFEHGKWIRKRQCVIGHNAHTILSCIASIIATAFYCAKVQ